ncbi:MAG: hypothetical protein ACTHLO_14140 [Pseudolabrys sp.]
MRSASLLIVLLCGLAGPIAPDMSVATEPAAAFVVSTADETDYQALQSQADMARDMLAQAQGSRLAAAQFAVN